MESEALFLQACSLPLPPDEDEISDNDEIEDVESDIEDYLVYDEISQVCVVCDVVLRSPSHGPLCKRCHSFMYPEFTILQKEFDEIRSKAEDKEKWIPYNRYRNPNMPKYSPRHRCGKDGTLKNESANKASSSNRIQLPSIMCFSDSEEDEDDYELLGLAQMSVYDKDMIRHKATSLEDFVTTIKDDFVENMPTESMCSVEFILHIFYIPPRFRNVSV